MAVSELFLLDGRSHRIGLFVALMYVVYGNV